MPTPTPPPVHTRGTLRLVAALVLLLCCTGPAAAVPLDEWAPPTPAPAAARHADGGASRPVPVGVWPLDPVPEVVAVFDPPATPYGRGHRGVDLAGRAGQPVRTALPGRVSFAAPLAGRGVVVVDHGATRTTYQPVAATVALGDRVAAGDVIGLLEAAGSHCAPSVCLHWGWIEGETYLDPLLLVGAGPVRLLPLDGAPGRAGADGGGDPGGSWQPLTRWWEARRAGAGAVAGVQARGWAWR